MKNKQNQSRQMKDDVGHRLHYIEFNKKLHVIIQMNLPGCI